MIHPHVSGFAGQRDALSGSLLLSLLGKAKSTLQVLGLAIEVAPPLMPVLLGAKPQGYSNMLLEEVCNTLGLLLC